jgi:hypothetical protein
VLREDDIEKERKLDYLLCSQKAGTSARKILRIEKENVVTRDGPTGSSVVDNHIVVFVYI